MTLAGGAVALEAVFASGPPADVPAPGSPDGDGDPTTRERVLHLVVARGPITAGALAKALDLTAPAVRRHLAALETSGQITDRQAPGVAKRGRGRPARAYVATAHAHDHLTSAYADLAVHALRFLEQRDGHGAVAAFADARVADLERRYSPVLEAAGEFRQDRVAALADALSADGYEATIRPVPGTSTLQLCQGHCPVRQVATAYPELCEAETRAFARLLGGHVQRLATLAAGGHVCTTSIPLAPAGVPAGHGTRNHVHPTPVEGLR